MLYYVGEQAISCTCTINLPTSFMQWSKPISVSAGCTTSHILNEAQESDVHSYNIVGMDI